ARWEKELDLEKAKRVLDGPRVVEQPD
ncbi:MAG: hypothetical protein JWP87_5194, partial [Labilithrix sp.]|nr:hypothetical protein [Labilithrix sp.]